MASVVLGNMFLFGRSVPLFFVSDDFAQLEWALGNTVLQLFAPYSGLYRPLQSLCYKLILGVFGLSPIPYHVLSVLIQTGNSLLLLWLVLRLTKSVPKALLCALLFTLHFMHVEPVIWISSLNILLATCFMLSGLILLRSRNPIGKSISILFSVLALLSSEAGLVMPLLVLVVIWASSSLELRSAKSIVPFLLVVLGYLAWRIPSFITVGEWGTYAFGWGFNILKNASFLITSMFVRLPYTELLDTWNASGGGQRALVAILTTHPRVTIAVIVALAASAIMAWKGGKMARFGGAFMVCAALPMVFLIGTGERLTYLPSVGFAVLAGLSLSGLRKPCPLMLGVLACAYLFAVAHLDSRRWVVASGISRSVTYQLVHYIEEYPQVERVYVQGLPDNYRGAYVFRGGIDSAARLISGRNVSVIKTEAMPVPDVAGDELYLEYREGWLLRVDAFMPP